MRTPEILIILLLFFGLGIGIGGAVGITTSSNGYTLKVRSLLCNDKGCSILVEYPDQTRHWDYLQHKKQEDPKGKQSDGLFIFKH